VINASPRDCVSIVRSSSSFILVMPLSALQQTIIRLCEDHERSESQKPGFRSTGCVVLGQYFIKYQCDCDLFPQFKTQQYIYEKVVGDKSAPRIPKVYDYFSPEHKMAYLHCPRSGPGQVRANFADPEPEPPGPVH
jgi:hypothetical protein